MSEPRRRSEPRFRTGDARRRNADRGQTLPDFALGIAIFLLTITVIVTFVPQLTLPFDEQEQSVVAERIANDLHKDLLAEGGAPSLLNESRTVSFFETEPTTDRLGVASTYSINITLRDAPSDARESAVFCEENGSIAECNGGSKLTAGPPIPRDDRSVSTARAGVFTEQTDAVLEVRVW